MKLRNRGNHFLSLHRDVTQGLSDSDGVVTLATQNGGLSSSGTQGDGVVTSIRLNVCLGCASCEINRVSGISMIARLPP